MCSIWNGGTRHHSIHWRMRANPIAEGGRGWFAMSGIWELGSDECSYCICRSNCNPALSFSSELTQQPKPSSVQMFCNVWCNCFPRMSRNSKLSTLVQLNLTNVKFKSRSSGRFIWSITIWINPLAIVCFYEVTKTIMQDCYLQIFNSCASKNKKDWTFRETWIKNEALFFKVFHIFSQR